MTFDPNGLEDFLPCPHCKINVIHDPKNHRVIPPDRLDCRVSKQIFKINTKEFTVTNDQLVNEIVIISKTVKELLKLQGHVRVIHNNSLNFHNRIEALEKAEMRRIAYIKGLAEDIVLIFDALKEKGIITKERATTEELPELEKVEEKPTENENNN